MPTTVYWASFPSTHSDLQVSELKYFEPISVLKELNAPVFFGPNASKCPAIVDEAKNTFKIKSPLDLNITFNENFNRFTSKYSHDINFLQHMIGPFGEDKVVQLAAPTYLFFCEESLLMTQLPPYYEETDFTKSCINLSATFDIGKWFRVIKPSFKIRQGVQTIDIKLGDALAYLKFNTEEKINLVRFDASTFYKENQDIIGNLLSFKFHKKNPFIPTKLSEGYDAFLRARYNKRVLKIIKENLLE